MTSNDQRRKCLVTSNRMIFEMCAELRIKGWKDQLREQGQRNSEKKEASGPPGQTALQERWDLRLSSRAGEKNWGENQMQGDPRCSRNTEGVLCLIQGWSWQRQTESRKPRFIDSGFEQSSKRKTATAFLSRWNPRQPDISKCLKWKFQREELFLPSTI